jgi:hypothetical protein
VPVCCMSRETEHGRVRAGFGWLASFHSQPIWLCGFQCLKLVLQVNLDNCITVDYSYSPDLDPAATRGPLPAY